MRREDVVIGQRYTYHPTKQDKHDNRHPECTAVGFSKRGRVQLEYTDETGAHKVTVSVKALSQQTSMFADGK